MSDSTAEWPADLADAAPLEQLRRRLIRIATASDIDEDSSLAIQSLDARQLLDQFPQALLLKDRRGRYVFANAAALEAAGMATVEELFGRTDFDILEAEAAERHFLLEQRLMAQGIAAEQEERVEREQAGDLWLLTTRTPMRNDEGQVVGLIIMSRDITERKRQDELQRGQAAVLEMVARGKPLDAILKALCSLVQQQLHGVVTSVLLLDENGNCLRHGASPDLPTAYTRLIDGVEIGPRVGSCGTAAWRRSSVVVRDIEVDPLWAGFRDIAMIFNLRSCWSTPILGTDSEVLGTFAIYSRAVREPSQREIEITTMATDLAGIAIERARNEERIQHMAHHDPLTGLPNRALFWPQFNRALQEARREGRNLTIAYIDLDSFKQLNDTLGHAAGDELLRTIAARILQSVRASDLVVRLGGDEFAIVFSHAMQDEHNVLRRLRDIRAMIGEPMEIDGMTMRATSSMGVSVFPRDGATPEELLDCADRAMYDAKARGRDTLEIAVTPMQAAAV